MSREAGAIQSGGGEPPPDLVDRDISAELQCALDKYLHPNVRLTDGRTMKRVNAWAFAMKVGDQWDFVRRSFNVSPGEGWRPVGGQGGAGNAYARLYNQAFVALPGFQRDGSRFGVPDNSFSGDLTSFETSLFASAHEATHLTGSQLTTSTEREAEADWYAIDAVSRFRSDGGAQCPGSN